MQIGLIGCGRWGRNILRDLLSLGCDIHVAEHREENRNQATAMGAASVSESFERLPNTVQGYVVAVQTDRHFEMLQALAETGKPVFVEKPMVPDLVQAKKIQELMGDRVFVMHKWRYHPGIQRLAELRAQNTFGAIKRLSCTRLQWKQPHTDVDAFWILVPHDLSIAAHIVGALPETVAVQADIRGDDIHAMTVLMGRNPAVQIEMSALYHETRRGVVAHFDEAIVTLPDPLSNVLEVRRVSKQGELTDEVETLPISTEYPLLRELRAFIEYLQGGDKPNSSVDFEINMMERLDELRQKAFAEYA